MYNHGFSELGSSFKAKRAWLFASALSPRVIASCAARSAFVPSSVEVGGGLDVIAASQSSLGLRLFCIADTYTRIHNCQDYLQDKTRDQCHESD